MEERHSSSQTSLSGFILGVVVGAVLMLLFTTKKGRRILTMLTDQGWSKLSELEGLLENDAVDGYEEVIVEEEQPPVSQSEKKDKLTKKIEIIEHPTSTVGKITKTTRRFFKGIKKRS